VNTTNKDNQRKKKRARGATFSRQNPIGQRGKTARQKPPAHCDQSGHGIDSQKSHIDQKETTAAGPRRTRAVTEPHTDQHPGAAEEENGEPQPPPHCVRHWTAIDGRNPSSASNEATTQETESHMAVAATAAPPSPTPPLDKAPPPQSNEGRDQTPPRSRSEPTPRSLGRAGSSAEINKRQQSRGRGRRWEKAFVTSRGAATARRVAEEGARGRRLRWYKAIGTGAGWVGLGSELAIFRFHDEFSRLASPVARRSDGREEGGRVEGEGNWNNNGQLGEGTCLDMKEKKYHNTNR